MFELLYRVYLRNVQLKRNRWIEAMGFLDFLCNLPRPKPVYRHSSHRSRYASKACAFFWFLGRNAYLRCTLSHRNLNASNIQVQPLLRFGE